MGRSLVEGLDQSSSPFCLLLIDEWLILRPPARTLSRDLSSVLI